MSRKDNLSSFSRNLWLTLGISIAVVMTYALYVHAEKEIDRANELRYQSHLLAEQLRQSSDELTRMVRSYVITGDPAFKQYYQQILDIRDGKRPRPLDYQNIYWDLLLADRHPPRPDSGESVPLLDLMRRSDFSADEFAKLAQAKANSDALTRTEFAAMALVESSHPATEATRGKAGRMLNDAAYLQAKADIMRPISEFNQLLEQRTLATVHAAENRALQLRWLFMLLGLSFLFLLWRTYHSMRAVLGTSLEELYALISRIGEGDFTAPISVAREAKDSVIAWIAETQTKLARLDAEKQLGSVRIQRLTQLYATLSQCNQAIVRCTDEAELFPQICRDAVTFGGMQMAWIGMLDEAGGLLKPVASFGAGTDYLDGIEISIDATHPTGQGPTGMAARENHPVWCQDFANDPATAPWHHRGTQFGWAASASLPITRKGRVVGTLTLYAGTVDAFDVAARDLLVEMTMDISFALDRFADEARRKRIEQELQVSLSLNKIASRVAKMGAWSIRLPEMEVVWSDEVCLLHEVPIGTRPTLEQAINFYAPESLATIRTVVERCIADGIAFDEELRFVTASGRRLWVRAIGEAMRNSEGRIIQIDGAFLDITEQKRLEEERLANEVRYHKLFKSLINGFALHEIICDEHGQPVDYRFIEVNPAFEKITGLKAAQLIGRTALEVIPNLERFWIERYGKVALTGEPTQFEFESGGLGKSFEVAAYSPKAGQFVTLFSDISERNNHVKALSAALDQANRFSDALDHLSTYIYMKDLQHRYVYANRPTLELFNCSAEELIGSDDTRFFPPETVARLLAVDKRVLEQGENTAEEIVTRGTDGTPRIYWEIKTPIYADNQIWGLCGISTDITRMKQMQDSLTQLSLAVEQSPSSIVITDLDANIVFANASFTRQTGYSQQEALGKNPRMLHSGKTPKKTYNEMWAHLTRGETWKGELINRRKDGSEYVESALISPVRNDSGTVTHYLAIKDDITEKKRAEERIQYLAHFDQLTGLPNRTMLQDHFKFALSLAQRSGEQLTVMFLDLDHFKNINDTLGHSIGDQLLMEVAKRLKAAIREEDTVSRLGGDEFIFILPGTDANGAAHVAEKLIAAIAEPLQIEHHELSVTPSIGIAIYPDDGHDMEVLSKNADAAMYKVKQNNRNDFRFFTQEMQANSARNLRLANALRQALKGDQMQLHYQPQLAMQDGHVIGAEALLRWRHPELGMISPAEFIPIAEDSGLIIEIGEWVLRTAVQQMKSWLDMGLPSMVIAVNLSAVQFRHANLPNIVSNILAQAGLAPDHLELELTEAVAMDDPQAAIEVMDDLHERGIRMSIDDFGTGYSSLSYLKRFKVYKLKIDQSFVRDISDDPEDKAIVTAIINMASSLGMHTIAEGVETASQLAFLRLQGCDEVQGYYFSKPLPSAQFEAYVRSTL